MDGVGGIDTGVRVNGRFAGLFRMFLTLLLCLQMAGEIDEEVYLQRGGTLGHDGVAESEGKRATAFVGEGEEEVRGADLIPFCSSLELPIRLSAEAIEPNRKTKAGFVMAYLG